MLLMWVIPFLGSGEFSILARGGFWNLRKRGFHSPPLKANLKIAKGEGRGDVLSSVVLSAPTSRFKYLNARWRGPWLDAALDRRK